MAKNIGDERSYTSKAPRRYALESFQVFAPLLLVSGPI